MNRQQKKFLEERISAVFRTKRNAIHATKPDTAAVKKARAIIRAHERAESRNYDARYKKLIAASDECRRQLLFGDPSTVLAMVDKFEAQSF